MMPPAQTPRPTRGRLRKSSLDKDLRKIARVEEATRSVTLRFVAPGLALLFLALAGSLAGYHNDGTQGLLIIAAAIIAAYMALTIGANDVANNVGPAVGARALTMAGALMMAAVFESAGALLAGGDVVQTIAEGLVNPAGVPDANVFAWLMLSALLSSALWVHLATVLGAPVSTTHSIVGAIVGASLVAIGIDLINWPVFGIIAGSWVVLPLFGGMTAAMLLAGVEFAVVYRDDKIAAARTWVPLLIALMGGTFTAYLLIKAVERVYTLSPLTVAVVSLAVYLGLYSVMKPIIRRQSEGLENRNQSLKKLFRWPLICSAALLSFAHGANDVANAVGPLAAILQSVRGEAVGASVALPQWVMLIGAFGISAGLLLFGPRLVRLVGGEITKMNPMRAYCVALSTGVTVLIASALGLPVSTTHIAVGSVFGVGFFREYWMRDSRRRRRLAAAHRSSKARHLSPAEHAELYRRRLVRRSHFITILAAWVVTVPAAAGLGAIVYRVVTLVRYAH